MKKAISVLILAIVGIFTSAINSYAALDAFSYNYTNFYSSYYGLQADLEITDYDAYGIEIYIPESDGHEFEDGNIDSYIVFKDENNTPLLSIDFINISGVKIGGWYRFDFENLGITSNVRYISMIIMSNYGAVPPSGFLSYMTNDTEIIYNYEYQQDLIWNYINIVSNIYAIQTTMGIVNDAKTIQIYIPDSEFHRTDYNGYDATLKFSDDGGSTYPYSYDLTDFNFSNISGIIDINLLQIYDDLSLQSNFTNFIILIPQSFVPPIPSGYIDYLNISSFLTWNNNIYSYKFYVDGILYDGGFFRSTIPLPNTPNKTGYYFNGWVLPNGETWDENSNINLDLLLNNNLDLYASWRERSVIDTTITDPTENNLMANVFATFNLNTNVGYIIVYLAIIMMSLFALNKFNMPQILTIITLLLITAFWMFLGFLPILMSIMAFAVLTYMLITNVRGGANE